MVVRWVSDGCGSGGVYMMVLVVGIVVGVVKMMVGQ